MNTSSDSWKVDALVDGQLDLASQLDMERRMVQDVALRESVGEARLLRELVRENADRHAAPDSLRARAATLFLQPRPRSSPAQPQPTPARVLVGARADNIADTLHRWLGWRPLLVSMGLAAMLVVAWNTVHLQSSRQERLMDDVVASHVRSTLGQHLVDVASSDRHTVKPFLSSRLDFSPPVDELQVSGSVFLGGRVDYLAGRPVAALVYRQGEHVVNSFVWPSSDSDSSPAFSAERGFQTAHWSANGMKHCVISDLSRAEFQRVVAAVQLTDASRN